MSGFQIEIQMVAVVTAVACSLPGVFLVLRQAAMMSDAISHTVLLGIVISFFLVEDLTSPLLIVGAAVMGVITVSLVSLLERTRLVKEDAAIGLVFPALFSIAVILISTYAGNVHLDTDAVLVGELAFAPFDRLYVFGVDIGPRGFHLMSGIALINLIFITVFYKELKLTTFDASLATALGFTPGILHYALMGLVSLTVVGSFDIVGSILVVALMVAPPATAYLITNRLSRMILLSVLLGIISALSGYWLAHLVDASIAGSMATMAGVIFLIVFFVAPERGWLAQLRRRIRQRWDFAQTMLMIHLFNHENTPEADTESDIDHMQSHMRWDDEFSSNVVRRAVSRGLIDHYNGSLRLTDKGRQMAKEAIVR